MPTNLPKTSVKFLIALLKHQAEILLGKDAAGIAANTVLDEDLQKRLDDWLTEDETGKKLLGAAEKAKLYLQDAQNCTDADLRHLFRDMDFGTLPSVQAALTNLPQGMDSNALTETLRNAFERDLPNLSPAQWDEGAHLYTDALLREAGKLEPFLNSILLQTALDLKKGQRRQDAKLDWIIATLQIKTPAEIKRPTQKGDLPLGSYLPIQPNPNFTGRETELGKLCDALLSNDGGVIINQQALVGMGGLGKTQLAVQFVWEYGHHFAGVHWVSAFKADEIAASIAQCGQEMSLQPWPQDIDQQAALTIAAWKQSAPRLVILDNLEDVDTAAHWMGRLRHSAIRILVTTRQKEWPASFGLHEIPLPTFNLTESLAFLRRALDESRASEADLTSLHTRFGGLPLPLDLAASYLTHVPSLSISDYLSQLSLDHPSLKNWRAKHPTATQHDKDVAATFALSWDRVDAEDARKVFLLAGYGLPNEPLPLDVLFYAAELEKDAFSEALDLLLGLSLLQPEPSLHPLLADFARLQDANHKALFDWARSLAWRGYPGNDQGGIYRNLNLARYLRLSLNDILYATDLLDRDQKKRSILCFHAAFLLDHFGSLDGAMRLYQQALEIFEILGDLQNKSITLHQMAGIYVTRGDLDGAMKLYEQALEILEDLGDPKGKSATLHQTAGIYVTRGDLDEAMKLYEQALEILEGLGDPKGKSATLHEIARIYMIRGNLDKAMNFLLKSLKIEEDLGDLRGKSATLHNIAYIHRVHGDLDEAMKSYQQSLELAKKLGSRNGISDILVMMAPILLMRGDADDALNLYQQALDIYEEIGDKKGKSSTLYGMAIIQEARGDFEEAMRLCQQSLEISDGLGDKLGKSTALHQMAGIYVTRGNLNEAMKLYQQALEIKESLSDLRGKAITLAMMGQVLWNFKHYSEGLRTLLNSIETLRNIGAKPDVEKITNIIIAMQNDIGAKNFSILWQEENGNPIPEWLKQKPKQK